VVGVLKTFSHDTRLPEEKAGELCNATKIKGCCLSIGYRKKKICFYCCCNPLRLPHNFSPLFLSRGGMIWVGRTEKRKMQMMTLIHDYQQQMMSTADDYTHTVASKTSTGKQETSEGENQVNQLQFSNQK
jgi:hypothetical protein